MPSKASAVRPGPEGSPQPAGKPVAGSPGRLDSRSLLGGAREVEIVHGRTIYRLRHTDQGKLILTK